VESEDHVLEQAYGGIGKASAYMIIYKKENIINKEK